MRQRLTLGTAIAALGGLEIVLAGWMFTAPDGFFHSLASYGPANDHLVVDLATFYLALGVATSVSVVRAHWRTPVLAVTAIQGALHTVNHLLDIGKAEPAWQGPFDLIALALLTAFSYWLFRQERTQVEAES